MQALLEESLASTVKIFEGKEVSNEEFMKAVVEKVVLSAPKKFFEGKIEGAELGATLTDGLKGSTGEATKMGYDYVTTGKSNRSLLVSARPG